MSGLWFARRAVPGEAPGAVEIRGYSGDEHPDGDVVDVPETDDPGAERSDWVLAAQATAAGRVSRLLVSGGLAPRAPALWYVEHPEPSARPPAMTLIGFATAHFADGTVVDQATFTDLPVRSADQAGAFRWWTATGQIHQIYVAPARRRQGIGTKLAFAAGAYRAARGWAPLWVGGERTDLGEAISRTTPGMVTGRITPRTRVLPEMTPPEARRGLPPRLFRPDPPER